MPNQREHSKMNWASSGQIEEINAGSLQRIADATEKMAQNYISLQADRDLYKRWYNEAWEEKAKIYRRISALQGVITRMKKAAKK